MSYEQIMEKVAATHLNMSPAMQDVILRVKTAGLHKAAAPFIGTSEICIKTATQYLGTELLRQHYKYQKIASSLDALAALDGEKTANMAAILGKLKGLVSPSAVAGTSAMSTAAKAAPRVRGISSLESVGKAAPWTGGLLYRSGNERAAETAAHAAAEINRGQLTSPIMRKNKLVGV